jgi:very-short-patch-repair endonuclease
VKGAYARGKSSKNINTIEAQAVVNRVKEHARECPTLSLGIATFSKVQQNHLNELLEHARRNDPILDLFLREGKQEDVFVKNLENVQGDERDVILVSVCYGPSEPGSRLASMNFGPVNGEGGERRLNVLFTRARYRTEIFCSFDPRDIDPSRTSNIGPKILQEYLLYAKDGQLSDAVDTGLEADSDFEIDVANEIRHLGYEVDHQIGSQGFKIDLAVRDKEQSSQFILAVECDGATYHSSLWARERDRLRQGILEQHGWTFHRIWSTDWFYRRNNEIERLKGALEQASFASKTKELSTGANFQTNFDVLEEEIETDDGLVVDISDVFERPTAEPYILYKHPFNITRPEPHLYPLNSTKSLITKIIETEGPIHQSEIARRFASCFGKVKAGKRIIELTDRALKVLLRDNENDVVVDEGFYLTCSHAENIQVRDRSELSGSILKADMHSRLEIAAAAEKIEEASGEVNDEELCREIAAYMGYKRTGPDLKKVLISAIKYYRERRSEDSRRAI